jgi:hypothetical protein
VVAAPDDDGIDDLCRVPARSGHAVVPAEFRTYDLAPTTGPARDDVLTICHRPVRTQLTSTTDDLPPR